MGRSPGMGRARALVVVIIALAAAGAVLLAISSTPQHVAVPSGPTIEVVIPFGISSDKALNFVPDNITVAPGTTVIFVNKDSGSIHNIHFTAIPNGASIPMNPSPDTNKWTDNDFAVTLTVPGTYEFTCDYHSWMVGSITVT